VSPARTGLAAAAAVLGAAVLWWAAPSGDAPAPGAAAPGTATSGLADRASAEAAAGRVAMWQGTGVTSGAQDADPLLVPGLRQSFEALLLEAGEAGDPATLKQRLAALVPRHFPPELVARATALIERYVDYRVALGGLAMPADPHDPRALRAALAARQQMRQRYFSPEEGDALFAQDAPLDRYTLARLEIERNNALTPDQKQTALREAEGELGETERAARAAATAHLAVAAQTAAFDAQGLSETERYAQRRAQYGDDAARQLARLDQEERDWQTRLARYAMAQTAQASPEQLQQLRQQLFTPQEQLRIDAALAARRLVPTGTPASP
jgi:lipase chaperone LimK